MNILYAPWRAAYAKSVPQNAKDAETSEQDCVFCQEFNAHDDEKYFIIRRFNNIVVLLNLYPYNAGHLLVMPIKHVRSLADLSSDVRAELMEVITHSITILQTVLKAQGINVGMNLERVAGAGIPSHLHMHVLPRWAGDTNFMPTLMQTKQISIDLREIYQQLKPAFSKILL